jgi:serine/threonine-protein kinase
MTAPQRYQVVARVATTRTGAVWQARDLNLDRIVALKEIPLADGEALAALNREASALAALAGEHVVAVYGIEQDGGHAYLVEEWVEGATVAAVLNNSGRMPIALALGVIRGALLGLAAAHRAGLVHGDVSLSNILVDASGAARLIDFGSVVAVGGIARPATGAFAAPEVIAGGRATPAADVFAAAAVLAGLLHGRTETVPSVRGVDGPVRDVLSRALDPAPERRYPDAAAFLAALEEAATRTYGTSWWTQAGLSAAATASAAALVPVVAALAPFAAVAAAGSTAATGAESANAAASTVGRGAAREGWRSRRAWYVGAGAVAVAAAGAVALAATRSSSNPAPHGTLGAIPPAVSTTVAAPTGTGSLTDVPTVSLSAVSHIEFTHSSSYIYYRLVSQCGTCRSLTRNGSVQVGDVFPGSGVDQKGYFYVSANTADLTGDLTLFGDFTTGTIAIAKDAGPPVQPETYVGYSVRVVIPDPSGATPQRLTITAGTDPASDACSLEITDASSSGLGGHLACPEVSVAGGDYVYAVTMDFDLTP